MRTVSVQFCDEFVGDAVRTDSCGDDDPGPCCCATTPTLCVDLASDKYIYHAHHHFRAKPPLIPILRSHSKPLPYVALVEPRKRRRKLISAFEMPLLHLPNELLSRCSEYLESESDINAFAQSNSRLYCLLNSYLYRRNVQQSESSALI